MNCSLRQLRIALRILKTKLRFNFSPGQIMHRCTSWLGSIRPSKYLSGLRSHFSTFERGCSSWDSYRCHRGDESVNVLLCVAEPVLSLHEPLSRSQHVSFRAWQLTAIDRFIAALNADQHSSIGSNGALQGAMRRTSIPWNSASAATVSMLLWTGNCHIQRHSTPF